ncbi:E3 ubiquitin-protein ligase TRIM33-like [Mercenaria mercenaria]|uniref:E3 ubiquitin-protein ligase TRIM33-like n=1 Tax=Mercenaria mercenaria TaxID=6596 RepID=UPI00234F3DE9|nr:E3 ubiquitin-protein ligase TRIM33-like [Mercenaria mercenaria]
MVILQKKNIDKHSGYSTLLILLGSFLRMATCRNYENTVVGSADDDHENQQNASAEADISIRIKYTCNPCKESNIVREALHYCPECQEFYCHDCVRIHRRMAKLKDHVVYGKSDEDKWGQKATAAQLNEKCTKHPSEIISIHCGECNELCCHVCISLKHSDCRTKEYIPTAAKGIAESTKLENIKSELEYACDDAGEFKREYEKSIHELYTKQATFLQDIADMRKQVNDVFDEMAERATLGLTYFGNTLRVNIGEKLIYVMLLSKKWIHLLKNSKTLVIKMNVRYSWTW